MNLVETTVELQKYRSDFGHYVFVCDYLQRIHDEHFLPNLIQLLFPREMGGPAATLFLIKTQEEDGFRSFFWTFGPDSEEADFVEVCNWNCESLEQVDLTYGAYPIQYSIAPFMVANFNTRDFASKKRDEIVEKRMEEENIAESHLLHRKMSFILKHRGRLLRNDPRYQTIRKETEEIWDNFICEIEFPFAYKQTFTMRIHYKHNDRENEVVELLLTHGNITYTEALILPHYVDGKVYWTIRKPTMKLQKIKQFDFTNNRRRHLHPDDEDFYFEERDDIPYWQQEQQELCNAEMPEL